MGQKDAFSGKIIETNALLRELFGAPPFSVLNTKEGSWQNRKREWKKLGIESHLGRDAECNAKFDDDLDEKGLNKYGRKPMTGISVFDPALCELMYNWYTPEGGRILDPFAGGSVRGVVAHFLGYKYTGIDIRQEQIDSNREQCLRILEVNNQPQYYVGDSNVVLDEFLARPVLANKVKISVKSLLQKFQICEPNYINEVCKGRCCESAGGLMVTVHKSEEQRIKKLGAEIENGFIKDTNCGVCVFKKDNLCSIHENKPFGCKASPFTLNKNNTLIVRNRYRMLKCYNTESAVPVYLAHRWSLVQIFGEDETSKIITKIQRGDEEVYAKISQEKLNIIIDNDLAKHPDRIKKGIEFDTIFTCPPYADLEVYSDLPGDVSNKEYDEFIKLYREIISKSCKVLKRGGYAIFVVGDIRDKQGYYRDFISHTKQAFIDAGCKLYNEVILLQPLGTAMLRAGKVFKSGKKLTKVHENILIFKKP